MIYDIDVVGNGVWSKGGKGKMKRYTIRELNMINDIFNGTSKIIIGGKKKESEVKKKEPAKK